MREGESGAERVPRGLLVVGGASILFQVEQDVTRRPEAGLMM